MDKSVYSRFPKDDSNALAVGTDIELCNIILQNRAYHKRLRVEAFSGVTSDAVTDSGRTLGQLNNER